MKNYRHGIRVLAACAAVLAWTGRDLAALGVGDVRLSKDGAKTLVKVATEGAASPTLEMLAGKVVVKVPEGKRAKLSEIKLKNQILTGIRFGQHDQDLHIVLDLAKPAKARLRGANSKGFEVELTPASRGASEASAGAGSEAEEPAAGADSAKAADQSLATLDPALAGYTYRLVDVALSGDDEHSEIVLTTDGPASYKPVVRQGGKALGVVFKNCSLAWSGDPGVLVDAAVDSVRVKASQAKGEASVEVAIALSQKLAYTIARDQNQVVLRITKPEREAAAPKRGDLETPVSLEVEDADVVGVIKGLCQEVGFDYQIAKELMAKAPPESLVTLRATKRPLREVLDTLLKPHTMAYAQQGNTLFIGSETEILDKKKLSPVVQKKYTPRSMTVAQLKSILDEYYKRSPEKGQMAESYFVDPRDPQGFLLVGSAQDVASVMNVIARYDVADEGEAGAAEESDGGSTKKTQIFKLQYLDPAENQALLEGAIKQLYPTAAEADNKDILNLLIDAKTRSVVVTTRLKYLRKIERLLARLDVPPAQVNIEGKIVEMNQGVVQQLGIQWSGVQNSNPSNRADFNSQLTAAFLSQIQVSTIQSGFNISSAITALVNEAKANLLSSPNITTNDNFPAKIETADNTVITTIQQTIVNNTIQTTVTGNEYRIPLSLEVTPRISSADKRVLMKVVFKLKSPSGNAPAAGLQPPTSEQTADTQVTVNSGDTAVIGGLLREAKLETERKVPVLGDIPLLGMLFKYKSSDRQKKEVVIFLTPTIVEN